MAEAVLKDQTFLEDCRLEIAKLKQKLLGSLTRLKWYESDMRVPIVVLIDPEGGDLYCKMRKVGIATEAGEDVGVDKNAVRLRISPEIDRLITLLNSI